MTVVIDCNVLVMCLTSRSPYHNIYQGLISGKFELAVTSEIIYEYHEIIESKYGQQTADTFIALLSILSNVHIVDIYFHWHLISADPDDNKYCDCAVASQASYLVTEDNHFNILPTIKFPAITTIGIIQFSGVI